MFACVLDHNSDKLWPGQLVTKLLFVFEAASGLYTTTKTLYTDDLVFFWQTEMLKDYKKNIIHSRFSHTSKKRMVT